MSKYTHRPLSVRITKDKDDSKHIPPITYLLRLHLLNEDATEVFKYTSSEAAVSHFMQFEGAADNDKYSVVEFLMRNNITGKTDLLAYATQETEEDDEDEPLDNDLDDVDAADDTDPDECQDCEYVHYWLEHHHKCVN